MSDTSRDTFPLRFRNAHNREALRQIADMTGMSMTAIAERAIEHEVILLAADLEHRLEQALEVVRNYNPTQSLESYLDAAAAGEAEGDLGVGLRAIHVSGAEETEPSTRRAAAQHSSPALDVLAAFSRG